jgi:hypothetical protein
MAFNKNSVDHAWQSQVTLSKDYKSIQLTLNCRQDVVKRVSSTLIAKDEFKIHFGQNILDFILPTEMHLSIDHLLNYMDIGHFDPEHDDMKAILKATNDKWILE